MKINKIPKMMVDFIHEHHVLTMATTYHDRPSLCSLFYCFLEDEVCFIFASSDETEHIKNIFHNPEVAAAVHYETEEVGEIKGIQIKGRVEEGDSRHEDYYVKQYPYASEIKDKKVWILKITELKYTDNNLGFGKKEVWKN